MCKFVSLYLIHASTGKGRGEGEGDGSGEGEGEGDCAGIGLGASAVRSASLSLLSRVALSNAGAVLRWLDKVFRKTHTHTH